MLCNDCPLHILRSFVYALLPVNKTIFLNKFVTRELVFKLQNTDGPHSKQDYSSTMSCRKAGDIRHLLQETQYTTTNKLIITNFELAGRVLEQDARPSHARAGPYAVSLTLHRTLNS